MALSTNLVSYWKLDEASGNASDSVGSNTLTVVGTVTRTTGKINNGAVFATFASDYLTNNTNLGIDGGACTYSMWVKQPSDIASGSGTFLACYSTGTDTGYGIEQEYNGGTRRIGFYRLKQGVSQDRFYHNVTLGTIWNHLVLTYDGSTVTGYLNGVSVGTVASSGSGTVNLTSGFTIYGGAVSNTINDEVGVWSRALTADEVSQIYNSGRGNAYPLTDTPSLYGGVAYYKLEDVADSIDGNTATNVGTATFTSGKIGNALTLNGSSQALNLNASLLSAYATCTISGWFKLGATGAYQRVVSKTDDSTYNTMIRVTNGNKLAGHITTATEATITGGTTLSSGTWYFATLVYDGANINLYLNGSTDATQVAKTGALKTATDIVSIGKYYSGGEYFNGQIDEVCIFNRALSSTEVTALYNSGNGRQYPFTLKDFIINEVLALVETVTNIRTRLFTTAENLGITEAWTAARGKLFIVAETLGLVEAKTILHNKAFTVLDSLGIIELGYDLRKKWNNVTKSVTSWTNGTKATTTYTNTTKNSTTWNNLPKS